MVQVDSAWNLEAHHVVSPDQLQLTERIPEASSTRGRWTCVALAAKVGLLPAPSLGPSTQPFRETSALLWVWRWSLLGPNPNPTPKRDPPLKPKPASNPNPGVEPPSGMGPHFSTRGRSRERRRVGPADVPGPNPTLAKALSPWGPNSNSDNTTHLGSRSGAG